MKCWRDQAGCAGMDVDLFFPIGSTGRAVEQTEQTKAVCATCPVSSQCLEWALATNQVDGVWGGTSEDERAALRRARQRRARGR